MAQFQSGGLTLTYDDIGPPDARPLILLHGFSTNRNENWRRVGWYGALERRRQRFIAFDARGHGESDKPHDPAAYNPQILVDDVIALMDHLSIPRADVLGYSMGGGLALRTAASHPDRVGDLIAGGVGGRSVERHGTAVAIAEAMEAATAGEIANPLLRSFRQFAEEQGEDLKALAACSRAGRTFPAPDDLANIRSRTLIVTGAQDQLAGDPQSLASLLPDARAVVLPGCSHFSAIPHALFKAAVFDFLDGELD